MLPIVAIFPEKIHVKERPSTLLEVKKILSAASAAKVEGTGPSPQKEKFGESFLDSLKDFRKGCQTAHFHISHKIGLNELAELMEVAKKIGPGLHLSLTLDTGQAMHRTIAQPLEFRAISQILWHLGGNLPPIPFFKSFSKMGTWNHLVAEEIASQEAIADGAALHPNIIHSWSHNDTNENSTENLERAYGQVTPLPGRSLGRWVKDPLDRLGLLATFGKTWLLRSRVDNTSNLLYEVGRTLAYHFDPPERLPTGTLNEICAMVAAGGTVATTHVRYNLERAHLIGYVKEKGVIVGNSSLKNPRPEYIDSVRKQSGLDLTGYVERGYTSVRPEYRGLGIATKLLEGLTQRAGDRKIFSVIGEDNEATKTIAIRNRTRKVATYVSEKAGKTVGIWMPEWMIDK